MEPKPIENIKNLPEPKSIKEISVFVRFAHFYQQFIHNLSAIAKLLTLILKIILGCLIFQSIKRSTVIFPDLNTNSFLNFKAKKSLANFKKYYCKNSVLQYSDVFKPIR